jgi:hypothetical protein
MYIAGVSLSVSFGGNSLPLPLAALEKLDWSIGDSLKVFVSGDELHITIEGGGMPIKRMARSHYLPLSEAVIDNIGFEYDDALAVHVSSNHKRMTVFKPSGKNCSGENLIETWLLVSMMEGMNTTQAMEELSVGSDKTYKMPALGRWRKGGLPSGLAINYMMAKVIPRLIECDMATEKLIEAVSLPQLSSPG